MEHLWSPWRMQYIEAARDELDAEGGCVFCTLPEREAERVLARGRLAYVALNKFPYNPGHMLIVPFRHTGDVEDLTDDESLELQTMLQRSIRALREEAEPQGYNVGMNLGSTSGAGIPDHLHWHLVPRWKGDTNFMPVVAGVRVLPELLADTARRLAPRFADA
jgi:ATP adenylyltransferase